MTDLDRPKSERNEPCYDESDTQARGPGGFPGPEPSHITTHKTTQKPKTTHRTNQPLGLANGSQIGSDIVLNYVRVSLAAAPTSLDRA